MTTQSMTKDFRYDHPNYGEMFCA